MMKVMRWLQRLAVTLALVWLFARAAGGLVPPGHGLLSARPPSTITHWQSWWWWWWWWWTHVGGLWKWTDWARWRLRLRTWRGNYRWRHSHFFALTLYLHAVPSSWEEKAGGKCLSANFSLWEKFCRRYIIWKWKYTSWKNLGSKLQFSSPIISLCNSLWGKLQLHETEVMSDGSSYHMLVSKTGNVRLPYCVVRLSVRLTISVNGNHYSRCLLFCSRASWDRDELMTPWTERGKQTAAADQFLSLR